ncbi:hypothetical protein Taro_018588, partial [Colocasia esculenta]|nr:hypothetical protein [Colocasia esculenta]
MHANSRRKPIYLQQYQDLLLGELYAMTYYLSLPPQWVAEVPAVMYAEDGCFPGLYCQKFLNHPWLPDGHTLVLSSFWGSMEVILSVDVLSSKVSRISPADSSYSWDVVAVDGDNILAVYSSPIDPPQIKYGYLADQIMTLGWHWIDVSSPFLQYSEKVKSLLSTHQFSIMKIPVTNSETLPRGAQKPLEAIFLSSSSSHTKEPLQVDQKSDDAYNPLIVVLHGGPHSVSLTSYSKSHAFLASLGFNLLLVNYRGSLGFGEEALQSLLGKIGCQDVGDVLTALDHVIENKLADPSKVAVLGGSHGGFLTTHLIGQAPDKFTVAAVRNPVCNLSLMVGTTDIPDWCYVETYGKDGKECFTEAPSPNHLSDLHAKSPISHLTKVKAPVLFLLGAQDLRVPVSNGLQYARALKEKGAEVKVIVFPNDVHSIDRPQSDFESFLNIEAPIDVDQPSPRRRLSMMQRIPPIFPIQSNFSLNKPKLSQLNGREPESSCLPPQTPLTEATKVEQDGVPRVEGQSPPRSQTPLPQVPKARPVDPPEIEAPLLEMLPAAPLV